MQETVLCERGLSRYLGRYLYSKLFNFRFSQDSGGLYQQDQRIPSTVFGHFSFFACYKPNPLKLGSVSEPKLPVAGI